MIGRLRGTVVERSLDGSCIVDVGGVGYEVFVPLGSLHELGGESSTLHIHTHVREDALVLYGFTTDRDRTAFRTVLSVSGVGPKLALAILSVLDADQLTSAISRGDKASFKGISGVGKKTVERLLLELKDKLPQALGAPSIGAAPRPRAAVPAAPAATGELAVVTSALVNLGFKPVEVDRALAALEKPEGRPVEELIREALALLG